MDLKNQTQRTIKFRAWDTENKRWLNSVEVSAVISAHQRGEKALLYPLMQFTGLHDDNDIEIYEGDIVEFMSISVDKPVFVEWNDDTCQFQFSDGQPINNDDTYGIYKRVIGNIYENPELL